MQFPIHHIHMFGCTCVCLKDAHHAWHFALFAFFACFIHCLLHHAQIFKQTHARACKITYLHAYIYRHICMHASVFEWLRKLWHCLPCWPISFWPYFFVLVYHNLTQAYTNNYNYYTCMHVSISICVCDWWCVLHFCYIFMLSIIFNTPRSAVIFLNCAHTFTKI